MRTRREDGIALPVAIVVLGIVLLLVGVALTAAVRSNRQTVQDLRVKTALQAANAGADLARSRIAYLQTKGTLLPTTPCIDLDANGLVSQVGAVVDSVGSTLGSLLTGMCLPTRDRYPNGAYSDTTIVTYDPNGGGVLTTLLGNVLGTLLNVDRTIVAQGTYQGVTRKVAVDVKLATTTTQTFGNYALSAINDLVFTNGQDKIRSMRSNGSISLADAVVGGATKTATACPASGGGDATPGPGRSVAIPANSSSTKVCGSSAPAAVAFALPPYDATGAAATNDNARLSLCNGALVDLPLVDWCPWPGYNGAWSWSASQRTLKTNQDPSPFGLGQTPPITVKGATYWLCRLEMQGGSHIRVPSGVNVRFVIDKAACPAGVTGPGEFIKENDAGFITGSGLASSVQIYVVGGGEVRLSGASTQSPFTVYASDSTVRLNSVDHVGAIAAKSIVANGGSNRIFTDSSVAGIGTTGAATLQARNFRECLGPVVVTEPVMKGCTAPAN